jgi:hypothetical protein
MNDECDKKGLGHFSRSFWMVVALILGVTGIGVVLPLFPFRTVCPVRVIDHDMKNILSAIKGYQATFDEIPALDAKTISRAIRGKDHRAKVFLDCPARAVSSTGELLDPWGTAYKFYRAEGEILIRSAGPNRRFNSSAEPDCDDYFR